MGYHSGVQGSTEPLNMLINLKIIIKKLSQNKLCHHSA